MASRPDREAIDTFMSIADVPEAVAVLKLQEHGGNLNEAVNAYFSERDRNVVHGTSIAGARDDFMDIDDPIPIEPREPPLPLLSAARSLNPFALLDPNFGGSLFDSSSDLMNREPIVTHPREVRQIPIEVKDGNLPSGRGPVIEDVTESAHAHGPDIHGTVILDEDEDEDDNTSAAPRNELKDDILGNSSHDIHPQPSAPEYVNLPDYSNDIEEEMIRAAIEASRQEDFTDSRPQQRQSHLEDTELAEAVSLSLKTAEQEKALRGQAGTSGVSKVAAKQPVGVELTEIAASNGRLEAGSSSVQVEDEDVEEQPLVRRRSRHMSSGSVESANGAGEVEVSPPSSPGQHDLINQPQRNGNPFPSDEWGGISSEEHDEAVMLEAAMFGGIPESGYHYAYAPHQFMRTGLDGTEGPYPQRMPRPPSPSLTAQRLIREQQDDEYLASLQADREKELKAIEEAEARRLQIEAARESAFAEERRREEESLRKLEQQQEFERQLAAKEASLPQEPATDNENAVNLMVRMPDGSRRGRRFLRSDKLQFLFDFIDIGRNVKPGTYRLIRPYPRRAFSDGESALSLDELGLTSKQEALFLELI